MKRSRAGLVALEINLPSLSLRESVVSRRSRGGHACLVGWGLVLCTCVALIGCSGGTPTPPPAEPAPAEPAPAAPGVEPAPGEAVPPPAAGMDPMSPTPTAMQPGVTPGNPGTMPGDMPPGEQSTAGGPMPGGPMPGGPGMGEPGMGGPGMGMEGPMPGGYGQNQKKQRPQDFNEWKEEDYLEAKKEGDFRLTEAAGHIAQTKKNDEGVALLRKILAKTEKPKKEDQQGTRPPGFEGGMVPGMGGYGGPSGLNQQAIEAVVRALGIISTPSAHKTLMEVFTGKFETDNNSVARLASFKELAVEPTPELEEAMFKALTQPEKLWSDFEKKPDQGTSPGAPGMGMEIGMGGYGAGGFGNDQLMQAIAQAVESSASEEFRTKLATFLLDPKTPAEKVRQLRTILEKPVPENIGAQLKLYTAQEVDDAQLKQNLEKYFLEYSSESLARILGVVELPTAAAEGAAKKKSRWSTGADGGPGEGAPGMGMGPMEGGMPGMGPGTPGSTTASFESDPTLPFKVAKYLWDPKLAVAMGLVLDAAAPAPAADGGGAVGAPGMGMEAGMAGGVGYGTDNRFANVVMIAATVPTDSMRNMLAQVLDRSWQAGPQMLEQAGLTNKVVWDPAFLITVKSLPWAKTASNPRKRPNNGAPPQPNGGPEEAWQTTGQKMVKHLCNNLATASFNLDQAATAEGFPVKLHRDAKVTARLDLEWPKDAPKGLAGTAVDPLRIHFVRIEETLPVVKALNHYRRQAKGAKERNTTSYVWFDRINKSEVPGVTKSLDVMITQRGADGAGASAGAGGEGYVPPAGQPAGASKPGQNEMALVIDVLLIETGKPAPAETPTEADAKKE